MFKLDLEPLAPSNYGSKPPGNKKNDRISQIPSRNMKNKVEAQPRNVNKKNRVVSPIRNVDVKHSLLKANLNLFVLLVVQIVLWYLDSGCSKHMTGNRSQLMNFVSKCLASKTRSWLWHRQLSHLIFGTLNKLAKDGLARGIPRHKFHKDHMCSPCALDSGCSKHMTGNRSQLMNFISKFLGTVRFRNDHIARIMGDINLYTISLDDMLKTSPICLLSKASKTKSWLWHRRLSHLNFGTLNKLAKDGLARGTP
nr:hypothetical protein [Tanacetum cinerariifolium]